MRWRVWLAPTLATLGLVWCVAVGWWIWGSPVPFSGTSDGVASVRYRAFSEISHFGPAPLIVPAVLAALAVWAAWRGQRLVGGAAAVLLAAFALVAGFSIGGAYIPAAGLLLAAAGLARTGGPLTSLKDPWRRRR